MTMHTTAKATDLPADIDLDSGHRIIGELIESLQENFKRDTNYTRPLLPPQANVILAVDPGVTKQMEDYISGKLVTLGFAPEEFRFTRKVSGDNGAGGLQRMRLEFVSGVTFDTIRKISLAIAALRDAAH